jgi:hypothetical protein
MTLRFYSPRRTLLRVLGILVRSGAAIAVNGPRWIAAEVAYRMGRRWM